MKKAIIRDILKVFAVGGAAALISACAGLLAYLSVDMFCSIPSTGGYMAVLFFAVATLALTAAISVVFTCGAWIVRKGKFSR